MPWLPMLFNLEECVTIGDAGQGAYPCLFPFYYNGSIYRACIDDANVGRIWCPTEVDTNGSYTGIWGDCSDVCPIVKRDSAIEISMLGTSGVSRRETTTPAPP